jgi:hypothetical protein
VADLFVAQTLWLLGQDDQWLRPRASALRVAIAGGALIDLIDAGAAQWAGAQDDPQVAATGASTADPLIQIWAERFGKAARPDPIPVIHAINALGPGMWETVGTDLSRRGMASDIPRPVRRWLPPRHRPNPETSARARTHLREVIRGAAAANAQDHGVLAVALCAGVLEHILSQSAFADWSVLEPTREFLEDSMLVRRLQKAVSYLVSLGPTMGNEPAWPGFGA